ncbi:MAG: DUF4373 domain-containing protein, partial [Bacteroidetes bacterium]|nr:DUF4373 domain-containing protein [Bacteroidota bacterium]
DVRVKPKAVELPGSRTTQASFRQGYKHEVSGFNGLSSKHLMARPIKNNVEYFPHDAGMRNDDRIKALRKKFKLAGYGIWNMLIEYLAGRDYFQFEYSDFNLEIIAGDFDAEPNEIREVISYCITLGLLQQEGDMIRCKTLEYRLEPVLSKRKLAKDRVSVTETTQRKVKKRKVKKSIIVARIPAPSKTLEERYEEFRQDLVPYIDQYGKETLRKFFDYWTEKNKAGKKMKFEMERTFELPKRLATWKLKDAEFSFTRTKEPVNPNKLQ